MTRFYKKKKIIEELRLSSIAKFISKFSVRMRFFSRFGKDAGLNSEYIFNITTTTTIIGIIIFQIGYWTPKDGLTMLKRKMVRPINAPSSENRTRIVTTIQVIIILKYIFIGVD